MRDRPTGAVRFADAAEAWFWAVDAEETLRVVGLPRRGRRHPPRPCAPRAVLALVAEMGLAPEELRRLRRIGRAGHSPEPADPAAELFADTMAVLAEDLRVRGWLR